MIKNTDKLIKVIVFDIDGTLLHRTVEKLANIQHHYSSNGRYIYLRPQIQQLILHFETLQKNARLVLWTSMMHKNAHKIYQHFNQIGLHFDKLYTQEHCLQNLSKDLNVVANDLQVPIQLIYLIDDSPEKRIKNQNFIQIQNYNGQNPKDEDLIRIIKQIYKILQIQYKQRKIQQVDDYQLINKMKFLSIKPQHEDQGSKKKNNRENKYREGNKKTYKYKQKQQQYQKHQQKANNHQTINQQFREDLNNKLQNKKQRGQFKREGQQNGQKNVKYKQKIQEKQQKESVSKKMNKQSKVIVFDLNKTLIMKSKQPIQKLANLKNDQNIQGSLIYNRPHLQVLKLLIQSHSNLDIHYIIWTTMTGKSTISHCKKVVQNFHFSFTDIINGAQNNNKSHYKDLSFVCSQYGVPLENVLLIDDSPYKNVKGQHFYNIMPFQGDHNDIQLIRVAEVIDKFIACNNQNCEIKKLCNSFRTQLQLSQSINMQKMKEMAIFNQQQEEGNLRVDPTFKYQSFIKNKKQLKCIVFDINQTLATRTQTRVQGIKQNAKNHHYFIYARPYLSQLNQFLTQNKIIVCLWSTIKSFNCKIFTKILNEVGFNYQMLYSGENLQAGKKNLQLVAKQLNIPLENVVLVDDNENKRIQMQNYIKISEFNPSNQQDDSLLHLIQYLKEYLTKDQPSIK